MSSENGDNNSSFSSTQKRRQSFGKVDLRNYIPEDWGNSDKNKIAKKSVFENVDLNENSNSSSNSSSFHKTPGLVTYAKPTFSTFTNEKPTSTSTQRTKISSGLHIPSNNYGQEQEQEQQQDPERKEEEEKSVPSFNPVKKKEKKKKKKSSKMTTQKLDRRNCAVCLLILCMVVGASYYIYIYLTGIVDAANSRSSADLETASRKFFPDREDNNHFVVYDSTAAVFLKMPKRGECEYIPTQDLENGVWKSKYVLDTIVESVEHVAIHHRKQYPRVADTKSVDFRVQGDNLQKNATHNIREHPEGERPISEIEDEDNRHSGTDIPCILVFRASEYSETIRMINPRIVDRDVDNMYDTVWVFRGDEQQRKEYQDYIFQDEEKPNVDFIHIPTSQEITLSWLDWPKLRQRKQKFHMENAAYLQYMLQSLVPKEGGTQEEDQQTKLDL